MVTTAGACETTMYSVDPSKPCVFPFVHNGTLYNGCTKDGNNNAWCSTATDSTGVTISDKWGICDAGCPDHQATRPTQEIKCEWSGEWSPSDQLGTCVCK